MAELTKVKLSILSILESNIEKLVSAVYDYLIEKDFKLPKFETKPNEQGNILKGYYIPMRNVAKLNVEHLTELSALEYNDFDKFGFYSFTIDSKNISYRCNLSINSKGNFGCSLIPIEVERLQLNASDLEKVQNSEVITIG